MISRGDLVPEKVFVREVSEESCDSGNGVKQGGRRKPREIPQRPPSQRHSLGETVRMALHEARRSVALNFFPLV